jgi:hypothetical protein
LLFTGLTVTFLKQFCLGVWQTLPLSVSLALGITLLGQAAGRLEGWSRFDSVYWSFITATQSAMVMFGRSEGNPKLSPS